MIHIGQDLSCRHGMNECCEDQMLCSVCVVFDVILWTMIAATWVITGSNKKAQATARPIHNIEMEFRRTAFGTLRSDFVVAFEKIDILYGEGQ